MNNQSQLTVAHRKQLVDMLKEYGELRSNARKRWNRKSEELQEGFVKEAARKAKADVLASHIVAAEKHLTGLKANLHALGFSHDNDGIDISYDAKDLRKALKQYLEKELGPDSHINTLFEDAQMKMLTVASFDEASAVLKSLQN
jgi:hypothetical protein